MKTTELTVPELATIAATRGLLGLGIGLLVADRLDRQQRRAIGTVLTAIGALSTIPLALNAFGSRLEDGSRDRR